MPGRSTAGAILSAIHNWRGHLNKGADVQAIFSTYKKPSIVCLIVDYLIINNFEYFNSPDFLDSHAIIYIIGNNK